MLRHHSFIALLLALFLDSAWCSTQSFLKDIYGRRKPCEKSTLADLRLSESMDFDCLSKFFLNSRNSIPSFPLETIQNILKDHPVATFNIPNDILVGFLTEVNTLGGVISNRYSVLTSPSKIPEENTNLHKSNLLPFIPRIAPKHFHRYTLSTWLKYQILNHLPYASICPLLLVSKAYFNVISVWCMQKQIYFNEFVRACFADKNENVTILLEAAFNSLQFPIVETLLAKISDYSALIKTKRTEFQENISIFETLCAYGFQWEVNKRIRNYYGRKYQPLSPFSPKKNTAANNTLNSTTAVKLPFDQGVLLAVKFGFVEILRAYFLYASLGNRKTYLTIASQYGRLSIIQFLFNESLKPRLRIEDVALVYADFLNAATENGHFPVVKFFFELIEKEKYGIEALNPSERYSNKVANHIFLVACKCGQLEIVNYLISLRASSPEYFSALNPAADNNLALTSAADNLHCSTVMYLISLMESNHIDPTTRNNIFFLKFYHAKDYECIKEYLNFILERHNLFRALPWDSPKVVELIMKSANIDLIKLFFRIYMKYANEERYQEAYEEIIRKKLNSFLTLPNYTNEHLICFLRELPMKLQE